MRANRALPVLIAWMLLLLGARPTAALGVPEAARELADDDQQALEHIASQPEPLRRAALDAAMYPDTLVELQLLQARSSAAFQERLKHLGREEQEALWEIARQPGLLEALADAPPSRAAFEDIAATHPAIDADAILRMGQEQRELLIELRAIGTSAEEDFEELVSGLTDETQQAYRRLVEHPELLTLLATHVRLAVQLGNDYRADPEATLARLARLSDEVAQREVEAEDAWTDAISEDPAALADLEESARAYAATRSRIRRSRPRCMSRCTPTRTGTAIPRGTRTTSVPGATGIRGPCTSASTTSRITTAWSSSVFPPSTTSTGTQIAGTGTALTTAGARTTAISTGTSRHVTAPGASDVERRRAVAFAGPCPRCVGSPRHVTAPGASDVERRRAVAFAGPCPRCVGSPRHVIASGASDVERRRAAAFAGPCPRCVGSPRDVTASGASDAGRTRGT
jgi:hypothetical protein